jgi:hypothetical protein
MKWSFKVKQSVNKRVRKDRISGKMIVWHQRLTDIPVNSLGRR